MYVCLCNALTDRHVREAAANGASRPSEVYRHCGCARACGNCARGLKALVEECARALITEREALSGPIAAE